MLGVHHHPPIHPQPSGAPILPKLSRRNFLKRSAALSAASTLIAAPALHAKTNANERLGAAVIGLNTRGGVHLTAFLDDPRTEVRYVVDVDEQFGRNRAEQVAEVQGRKPKWVRDMREAFDDDSVDLVSVATPNRWHALVGIWAMQADKDAYVEKPVSHGIAEGAALV